MKQVNVAFIPVRGGSKSIPLKNIMPICGKPLAYWVIKAACECERIGRVYAATDSALIRDAIEKFAFQKLEVVGRSAENASDTATTESALLEFAERHDFQNVVLIQATSPLLRGADLASGFALLEEKDVDSVLSVVRQKRFIWEKGESGFVRPVNYDVFNRPRRQSFGGYLVENGAFYITSRKRLLETRNRISGNIRVYEMCEESYHEIDEPGDWIIVERLLKARVAPQAVDIRGIKLVATDCDGVLTDAGMYYSESGDEGKKFNTRDGHGFSLLHEKGIRTAVITSEISPVIERRAKKLNTDDVILGTKDKLGALKTLCDTYGLQLSECAYIGDDLFDIPAISACGFGCAPLDADDSVKAAADYVTNKRGGEGCFREVADLILGLSLNGQEERA